MNKYVWSETNQNIMRLMQIGANVTVISSQMVYVSFDISDEIKVSYVYNINKKNKGANFLNITIEILCVIKVIIRIKKQ